MNSDLEKYIEQAKAKGLSNSEITKKLLEAGWDKTLVDKYFHESDDLPVPAPTNNSLGTEKNTEYRHLSNPLNSILYIIGFIVLLVTVYSSIIVSNNVVEYYLPAQNTQGELNVTGSGVSNSTETLYQTTTVAIAALIISLPSYLGIMLFLKRDEDRKPIVRKSWSRKISYFLVILNSAGFCMGAPIWIVWLIVTQNSSTGDLLKFFINFSLNFIPLVYYFLQLRDDKKIFS